MALHDGHRSRMYNKLDKGGLAEHEWLETLLFAAIPRKNTNELAHRLIAKFGSIKGVLSASLEDLKKVEGVGVSVAGFLICIGHILQEYNFVEEERFEGRFHSAAFIPFVKKTYQDMILEVADFYLLDGEGHVMKRQRFSIDSICKVEMVPEEMSSFLITERASGVVLVHNHPFGEAVPSEADDQMTKQCQILCSMHNRLLCDHIIYAPNGVYSYYDSGRMKEISKNYSIQKFLES